MQKRAVVLGALVLLLIFSLFAISAKDYKSGRIEQKVLSEAAKEGKVKVIVQLKDVGAGKGKFKAQNDERAAVFDKIGREKIRHEFSSINGFSASLSLNDLAKLEQDGNVERIYYDRPLSIDLAQSTSIINATLAWRLQSNGVNLTGKGQTICIIDTGVDYTHPDLGNCTPVKFSINGTNESYVVESAHPYNDGFDYTWKINKTGYTKIGVHFANISTERQYDYVYVMDGNKKIVAAYSGSLNDTWSPSVDGDTIYVRLKSDESINYSGFYIDRVIDGTTNTTYNWNNCTKIVGGWDTYNYDPDPIDDHGHGTHVTGIAAANGTITGVAPEAKIISIKALNSTGGGESGDVIAGIDWCTNNSEKYNISVISMSLGGGLSSGYCDTSDPLTAVAINAAVAKNISVIVAAGNDWSTTSISYPACIQNATPVGSVDKSDVIAGSSNRNSLVQLFAPGVSITSTCATFLGGGSCSKDGTSMATPHVAGAFAIVNQYLALNGKTRTPQQIESVLNATGKTIPDSGSGLNFSRINVYDAIMSIDVISPNVTLVGPEEGYSTMDTNSILFEYNVTDNGNLSSCSLIINNVTTDYNASTINTSATNSISKTLSAGGYTWSINCTDVSGNNGNSSTRNLIVNATPTPPSGGGGGGGKRNTNMSIASSGNATNGTLTALNQSASGGNNLPNQQTGSGSTGLTYNKSGRTLHIMPEQNNTSAESAGSENLRISIIVATAGVLVFLVWYFYMQYKRSLKHLSIGRHKFWG